MILDKPIAAKIIFSLKNISDSLVDFLGFSTLLYHKNLIFDEPRELRISKNGLELVIIFRDLYSYNHWKEIIDSEHLAKIKSNLSSAIETIEEKNVIVEIDKIKNCVCEKTEYHILRGRSLQFSDELICNNCLGQISYSKIPLEIAIEKWQNYHQRFYLNWLESGIFEASALDELLNYESSILNLEGEKIRKQLSDFFQLPVYLHLFSEEPTMDKHCLRCGSEGIESYLNYPSWLCPNCFACFGEI